MTPRDLLRDTARLFRDAGIPDPETDSALLLSFLCGRPPLNLRLDSETELDDQLLDRYHSLVSRRLLREPLQYIVSEAFFCGHSFYVNPDVLIPRPETELLCEWAEELLSPFPCPSVLDLCCGSGCIGISLKLALPRADVVLSDLSGDALAVARRNADRLQADVAFCRGDLFSDVRSGPFRLIVSNPPYIPSRECASLQPEVRHEPLAALDGGADGLSFYRRICDEALRYLLPEGVLLFEVGDRESEQVAGLMRSAGFRRTEVRRDYQQIPRMVAGYAP